MSGKSSKSNAPKKNAFERKDKKDGSPNPKYVDLLEVDKPIAGQSFGCFSFISPETTIKQREKFFFEEFLKKWEMNKSMEKFHQFLNFVSYFVSSKYSRFPIISSCKIVSSSVKSTPDIFISSRLPLLKKLSRHWLRLARLGRFMTHKP